MGHQSNPHGYHNSQGVLRLGATGARHVWWPIRSVMAWNSWVIVGRSGLRMALIWRSEKYPRQLPTPHTLSIGNKCGMWSHKITEQMEAYKYAQDQKHCTESTIQAFLFLEKIRWCQLKSATHHLYTKHMQIYQSREAIIMKLIGKILTQQWISCSL